MSHVPTRRFWGDLRSLMHAEHLDLRTLTALSTELLEPLSEELKAQAMHYIRSALVRRQDHDTIHEEFSTHSAPSCFGEQSEDAMRHVDEHLALGLSEEDEAWMDEYDRYEMLEESFWMSYGELTVNQGVHPERLIEDLCVGPWTSFYAEHGEHGELLRVTCHIAQDIEPLATWTDPADPVHCDTRLGVHIACEVEFEELCF